MWRGWWSSLLGATTPSSEDRGASDPMIENGGMIASGARYGWMLVLRRQWMLLLMWMRMMMSSDPPRGRWSVDVNVIVLQARPIVSGARGGCMRWGQKFHLRRHCDHICDDLEF